LCPIDGSEASNAGLEEAIRFAQHQHATIRLLYIIDRSWLRGRSCMIEDFSEQLLQRGIRILEAAQAKVAAAEVNVLTTLSDGSTGGIADEIISNCRLWNANLIVMGTNGCHGDGCILIGNDAELVIQKSEVPVLLVNGKQHSGQRLMIAATKRYALNDPLICYTARQLSPENKDRFISHHAMAEPM
jgi:universal stress protein A